MGLSRTGAGRWLAATVLAASGLLAVPAATAAEATCDGPRSDFNGDGIPDVVLGQPRAGVDSHDDAGALLLLYGGSKGARAIVQSTPDIPGTPESGDRFGAALATADLNGDRCTDIVASAPYEDVGIDRDAGAVWVIPGSPAGLNLDQTHTFTQDAPRFPGTPESGDRFGAALAASSGVVRIAIGSPGEDHHAVNSGSVYLLDGGAPTVVHQDTPGIPGHQEDGDRFGTVIDIARGVYIGVPYENIGSVTNAGLVHHLALPADGEVISERNLHQGQDDVSGRPERGDRFGAALDASGYVHNEQGHLGLGIGVPGESVGSADGNHGMVHLFTYPEVSDGFGEQYVVHQDTSGVAGVAGPTDRFGSLVSLWAGPPDPERWNDRAIVVSVLSRHEGSDSEQGTAPAIQLFQGYRPGTSDHWVKAGDYGLPADAQLSASYAEEYGGRLYLADDGIARAYGIPTGNIVFGETEPVLICGPSHEPHSG